MRKKTRESIEKGLELREEGEFEEALKLFLEVVDDEPTNSQALAETGRTMLLIESSKENKPTDDEFLAIFEILEKATDLDEDNICAWLGMADVLMYLQRDDEALKAYDRAIELDPSNPTNWLLKGWVIGERNLRRQLACCQKALKLAPKDDKVIIDIGKFLESLSMSHAAKRFYEIALKYNPQSQIAKESLLALAVEFDVIEEAPNDKIGKDTNDPFIILAEVEKFL